MANDRNWRGWQLALVLAYACAFSLILVLPHGHAAASPWATIMADRHYATAFVAYAGMSVALSWLSVEALGALERREFRSIVLWGFFLLTMASVIFAFLLTNSLMEMFYMKSV